MTAHERKQPRMFIVTLTYTAASDVVDAHRDEHRSWLDPHVASGLFLVTGPMNPRTGGILIVSARISRDELADLLTQDPFHIHGAAKFAIVEMEANKITPALQGRL